MKKRRVSPSFVFKTLFLLILSINLASTASATLVSGSSGTTYIATNVSGTGSFNVKVEYGVYDGKSTSDPKGMTTDMQIAFKLTHMGSGGAATTLKFGRFTVFAPSDFGMASPFYSSASTIAGTGKTTSSIDIDPPPYPPSGNFNRAKFYFQTGGLKVADFASGEVSQWLVVTAPSQYFPSSVLLEINSTNSVPSVAGDVYVNIVPEPCSIAIFGGAFFLLRLMRHRRK